MKIRPRALTEALVAAGAALAGFLLLTERPETVDPYGPETGRGTPGKPPIAKSVKSGYETREANGRNIAWVLFGLFCLLAFAVGFMILMQNRFEVATRNSRPPLTQRQEASVTPPAPHVQAAPQTDLTVLRGQEEERLHGYEWLGTSHQAARIPIERAMVLMEGRSLAPLAPSGGPAQAKPGSPKVPTNKNPYSIETSPNGGERQEQAPPGSTPTSNAGSTPSGQFRHDFQPTDNTNSRRP